jgi:hypothetical protein
VKGKLVPAFEDLLLEAASTMRELAGALEDALGALQSKGQPITGALVKRCIDAVEKHVDQAPRGDRGDSPLVLLAKAATRPDAARLLTALLLALLGGETADVDATRTCPAVALDPQLPEAGASPREAGTPGVTALAEAAWGDADEALGRALQDMDLLARSFERLETAPQGELADRARRAKSASSLVLQWVLQAARSRNVAVLNKPGDRVPFDPAVHELDGDAEVGELVRIVKPAVVRGSEAQQVVLLRAEAELA